MLLPRRIGDDYARTLPRPRLPEPRRPVQRPTGRPQSRPAPQPRAAGPWVAGVAVWLCALSVCLLYVYRQGDAARLGIAMSDQKQETRRLLGENELLTAQVLELRSLSRIGRIAAAPVEEGGLGMVSPQKVQVAVIDPFALAPEPAAAVAASADAGTGVWQRVRDVLLSLWPGQPLRASPTL